MRQNHRLFNPTTERGWLALDCGEEKHVLIVSATIEESNLPLDTLGEQRGVHKLPATAGGRVVPLDPPVKERGVA